MSFRNRLRLFFLAIVLLPMIAVGAAFFVILGGTESGKADAGAAARGASTAIFTRSPRNPGFVNACVR